MFYVGQKVVCVSSGSMKGDAGYVDSADSVIAVGEIYTVTAVRRWRGMLGLQLAEANPTKPHHWGFIARRFRPVVDRPTDISIFTAMLNPSKQEIEA